MKAQEDKVNIYGMVYHNKPKSIYSEWDNYGTWEVRIVKEENGAIRNIASETYYQQEYPSYGNLRICGQYTVKKGQVSEVYGWRIEYDGQTVNRGNVDAMAKTLKAIDKKMAKYQEEWGHANTFSAFAAYFLKAIGALGWKRIKQDTGWGYDTCEFFGGRVAEWELHKRGNG